MTDAKPLSQRVRDSERRAMEAGARPIPRGMLTPQGAADLDTLMRAGYAGSLRAVIERALREAAQRHS